MAENIVALPLTPYLPLEVLQFLFTRMTSSTKDGHHGRKAAAAGQQGKQQQQQQRAAAEEEQTESAAGTTETGQKKARGQEKETKVEGGQRSPLSVILLLYGSGTAPGSPELLSTLKNGIERGVNVVVLSQCARGCANLLAYENGVRLHNLGVISGKDLTLEACVAKLSYLTGKGFTGEKLKELMEADLRGEITENMNKVGVGNSNSRATTAAVAGAGGLFSVSGKAETPPPQGEAGDNGSPNEKLSSCDRYSLSTKTCDSVFTSSVDSSRPSTCSSSSVNTPATTRSAACDTLHPASAAWAGI